MIEPLRHLSVFSPQAFGDRRVDVIGAGATGSRIALSLAKLGVKNIHAWDDDRIEEHNIANQVYGNGDIGQLKVDALKRIIEASTGTVMTAHPEKVDGSQRLGEVVFLLTDTMASRRTIWEGSLKFKLYTKLMVETRMGADSGRIYAVNPNRPSDATAWENTLYDDTETEEMTACRSPISVGPTAEIISGFAVWQMIRWFAIEQGGEGELDQETVVSVRPATLLANSFAAV